MEAAHVLLVIYMMMAKIIHVHVHLAPFYTLVVGLVNNFLVHKLSYHIQENGYNLDLPATYITTKSPNCDKGPTAKRF